MGRYFLVARNERDNTVQIINLDQQWYLGKNVDSSFKRENSLEAIDLVTTRFSSETEMIRQMYHNGYLSTPHVDLYIASKKREDGVDYIKEQEIIYDSSKTDRIHQLREIAKASLKEDLSSFPIRQKVATIFDKLISVAYYQSDFLDLLSSYTTTISKKLIDSIKGETDEEEVPYGLKSKEAWALHDYSIIRNIVETFVRMENFKEKDENLLESNLSFIEINERGRKEASKVLFSQLDKDYVVGQYSLFEMEGFNRNSPEQDVPLKKDSDLLPASNNSSLEESRLSSFEFVLDCFQQLPMGTIIEEDSKYIVNPDMIASVSFDKIQKLQSLLKGNLAKYLFRYIVHNDKYEEAKSYQTNTVLLEEELRKDVYNIKKCLDQPNALDKTVSWCELYAKCYEENRAYNEANLVGGDFGFNDESYHK